MKKYLIKTVATATAENPNFAGQVRVYYYGKNQSLLGSSADVGRVRKVNDPSELPKFLIEEDAYSRKCDAARSWILNNPEISANWTETTEIVEVEI